MNFKKNQDHKKIQKRIDVSQMLDFRKMPIPTCFEICEGVLHQKEKYKSILGFEIIAMTMNVHKIDESTV